MTLNALTLNDKKYFEKFLKLKPHLLAAYAFENIYIWKALFDISWAEIQGHFCLVFSDRTGSFLYLPPLGEKPSCEVVREAFRLLGERNRNPAVSRIENIEEENLGFYRDSGFEIVPKSRDYLCCREELVRLSGDPFKSKRSACNYFTKHYEFEYGEFSARDGAECLELYDHWQEERKNRIPDQAYRELLKQNRAALEVLLKDYAGLEYRGRVVRLGKKIRAFTFGFEISADVFCVLYEVTDLGVKGLAQFIFRKFASELTQRWINIMDDCGMENLKRLKLSYHPKKIVPAYIVKTPGV